MQCNLSAIDITPGDFIYVTNEELGFSSKVFEVVSSGLAINSDGTLGVSLTAQEASAATFDWQASDEQAIISADPLYRRVYEVQPPTDLTVSSEAVIGEDGTAQTKWSVSFDQSVTRNVQYYELQKRLSSDTDWDSTSIGDSTTVEVVGGVVPGQQYVIRVRAVAPNGAASSFATATHVMAGDSVAPAAPTGLVATGGIQSIEIDWNGNTEADLRGYYIYEHTADQFSNATRLGFVSADLFTRTNLPDSATRYYWVSAVDYSGNESAPSASAFATTDEAIAAEDTKAANGYVYYQISTSGQPSRPSASSYNFSNGSFSGLSSNWSIQPPEVDGSDSTYWASSWSVLDENGTQTINFSTPFRSFQFDGLVTFTNLNNELSDPNSSQITTIDGGLIKTGVVEANRIELDGNTIEAGASGIRIKNLGVDTLQIADNAVIIPVSQTVNALEQGTGSFKEIQWLNVTLDQGARLVVLWSGSQFYADGIRNNFFQLRIDGQVVQERGGLAITVAPSLSYSEEKNPGTYRVAVWWNGQDSTIRVTERTLTILGAKK